jgi:O-antigen/teichoic acid export membrane protein
MTELFRDPQKKWFDREHLQVDLKGKSIKGGLRTVGAQIFSFALNVATTILLARLLLPEDYGIVAMVTSFTGFVLIFKDLGMSQAIIQQDGLNQIIVSKVFWFNVWVSFFLALIIISLGPLLVMFYKEPRLLSISFLYALTAIAGGVSTQHSALLSRQMQFKALSNITMLASLFSLLPALIMAYLGLGYWSLVAINILNPLISAILLWMFCDWRPTWTKVDKSIKSFIIFGAGVSGFNMINYFSRNLDNILIGKYLGSGPLGLYSKAYQLLMLPITQLRDPLNAVGIPAMSALKDKPESYRQYYFQFLFLLSFFSMPIVVFLYITARPIILFLLGPNWVEASTIFKLLAITAFIQPIASTRGMVMLSLGLSTRYFMWGVYNMISVVIAFFIGINYGLTGLAISYAIVNYLILIPSLMYCFKDTPISVNQFFISIIPIAIISISAGIFLEILIFYLPEWPLIISIIIYVLLYGFIYILLFLPLSQTRHKIFNLVHILQSILKRKT